MKKHLATIKVKYNDDILYYIPSKKQWYILKNNLHLKELHLKRVDGQDAYKEKGGDKAYTVQKWKRIVSHAKSILQLVCLIKYI